MNHDGSAVAPGLPGSSLYPKSPLGEQLEGVPTGRDVEWEPLVDYRRNGVSETTIHGAVAWAHGDEVIHSFGGNVLCYGRSMMKPFMIKAFVDELEACSWEQKAIAVASHNGDTEHVAAAQSLLNESEWPLMLTPLDVPLIQFGRQVRRPRRWYHTCSGEHAAILHGCRAKGWNRAGYTLPSHEVFHAYMQQIRRFLGEDWTPLRIAKDGCGLPTVSNTVAELAVIYAGLVADRHDDWIWEAMCRHPDLVGGFNRLDSTIIKAGAGEVIAKERGRGLLGLSIAPSPFPKNGVVKIVRLGTPATWCGRGPARRARHQRTPPPAEAFVVPGIVPPNLLKKLDDVPTWDEWIRTRTAGSTTWRPDLVRDHPRAQRHRRRVA
ncbi:MAG: hypothetical protein CM15mP79_3040 [Methanobacteriota archaeon]|nr:MAG: hypothetical protein CM15mP79_3040 [Euryarchaeota archaeon]